VLPIIIEFLSLKTRFSERTIPQALDIIHRRQSLLSSKIDAVQTKLDKIKGIEKLQKLVADLGSVRPNVGDTANLNSDNVADDLMEIREEFDADGNQISGEVRPFDANSGLVAATAALSSASGKNSADSKTSKSASAPKSDIDSMSFDDFLNQLQQFDEEQTAAEQSSASAQPALPLPISSTSASTRETDSVTTSNSAAPFYTNLHDLASHMHAMADTNDQKKKKAHIKFADEDDVHIIPSRDQLKLEEFRASIGAPSAYSAAQPIPEPDHTPAIPATTSPALPQSSSAIAPPSSILKAPVSRFKQERSAIAESRLSESIAPALPVSSSNSSTLSAFSGRVVEKVVAAPLSSSAADAHAGSAAQMDSVRPKKVSRFMAERSGFTDA
jgi:hypothetical protein